MPLLYNLYGLQTFDIMLKMYFIAKINETPGFGNENEEEGITFDNIETGAEEADVDAVSISQ